MGNDSKDNAPMSRRDFLKWGAVNAAGAIVAGVSLTGCAPSEPTPPPKIFGPPEPPDKKTITQVFSDSSSGEFTTNPEFQELRNQLLNIESQWTKPDLSGNDKLRADHLNVSAKIFADYSGTLATKESIVNAVHFLPREEYIKKFPDASTAAAGHIDNKTYVIYIPEQALIYTPSEIQAQKKRGAPWFSPISGMRMVLFHELFHRDGIINGRYPITDYAGSKRQIKDYNLYQEEGFSLIFRPKPPHTGPERMDKTFEEAYATNMSNWFSEVIFRTNIQTKDVGNNAQTLINNLSILFESKPQWRKTMQKCHDSKGLGLNGFALFLAQQDQDPTMRGKSDDDLKRHGMDILFSMQGEDNGTLFNQYLTRLPK